LTEAERASLGHHLGSLAVGFEWLVTLIELFAIAVLLVGLARFIGAFVGGAAFQLEGSKRTHTMNACRIELGRHILASLEVFIVSDVIRTVVHLTFENLLLLGLLILIRSVISFFLEREMRNLEGEQKERLKGEG
jgi:uncharacterized membrane protein